ncbi:MAG: hypothetical protein FJ220_01725, partial [Kiritimatiellaceae bacterium]|nr:hypothetical protein [Kiritimatiellaceae bacterium]
MLVTGLLGALNVSTSCFAGNPFITSIYTADPSARVWGDGRLYIYASHDDYPPTEYNKMDGYHVFSTDDLVNWTDEGEILNSKQVSWGLPGGGFMWAPDCAFKNGTYYLYFPHPSGEDWNETWKIGIATSQKPASDFTSQGYIKSVGGPGIIDPNVFVDENGAAYLYVGGAGTCYGGKLKNNMVELDGQMLTMIGLTDFYSATWVFKRDGTYFLTYADAHPEGSRMHYATSQNPLGPWTYRGIYLSSTGPQNNQGSVVEYKGRWYAFYHNQFLSGQENLRSICIDRLFFDTKKGTITEVAQSSTGVPSVGSGPAAKRPSIKYEAENGELSHGATVTDKPEASGGKC